MKKIIKCDWNEGCTIPATYWEKKEHRCYCSEHANILFGNDYQWRKLLEEKEIVVPLESN